MYAVETGMVTISPKVKMTTHAARAGTVWAKAFKEKPVPIKR